MTARQHSLSNQDIRLSASNTPTQVTDHEVSSDLKEGITRLCGGISGFLFVVSLIFVLQAPLLSGGIWLALMSGWGGTALYQSRSSKLKEADAPPEKS